MLQNKNVVVGINKIALKQRVYRATKLEITYFYILYFNNLYEKYAKEVIETYFWM